MTKLWNLLNRFDKMEQRLTCSVDSYIEQVTKTEGGQVTQTKDGPLLYIDRGADVLAVAHLDAVGKHPHFFHGNIEEDVWVFSPWLDDRLGAFLILDVLPQMGLDYDILLTTGEEEGKSTAWYFEPPKDKKYRYMFQPDRMGTDVVHYQYHNKPMFAALRKAGFKKLEYGSYTDIVELEHLGVCGFNVGIGYYENHTRWCRASLNECYWQMCALIDFYEQTPEVTFPFDPKEAGYSLRRRRGVVKPVADPGYRPGPAYGLRVGDIVYSDKTGHLYSCQENHWWSELQKCHLWSLLQIDVGDETKIFTYLAENELHHLVYNSQGEARLVSLGEWIERGRGKTVYMVKPELVDPKIDWTTLAVQPRKKNKKKRRSRADESDGFYPKACEGNPDDALVRQAREAFEKEFFPSGVVSYSTALPAKDILEAIRKDGFWWKAEVITPYGQGRIDCFYPVVPVGDTPHFWILYDRPDEQGDFLGIVPAEEISLSPKSQEPVNGRLV